MTDREDLIATVLQHVAGIARDLTAARSRPFGEHRLSRNQLDTLFVLAHSPEPVTAGHLADALSVTPGAVTQLVAGLRDAGLVQTVTSEADARVRVIRLTEPARDHVEQFERDAVRRMAARFDGLDANELRELARVLTPERSRK